MQQAHAQAVLDLLDADNASPALVVQDDKVTEGVVPPYVLAYFAFPRPDASQRPDASDMSFDQSAMTVTAILHNVGGSASAARRVAARSAAALLNVTPTVAGRSCSPIRCVDGHDAQRDEETLAAVFDLVDVYEFTSYPG
jgi:hypothetical protein